MRASVPGEISTTRQGERKGSVVRTGPWAAWSRGNLTFSIPASSCRCGMMYVPYVAACVTSSQWPISGASTSTGMENAVSVILPRMPSYPQRFGCVWP
jgi:hypothetical protein